MTNISGINLPSRREENQVFAEWKREHRPELLEELGALLLQHASAVTYLVFKRRREDVAQEAVTKGLAALGSFRGDSLFSTWFHAVAENHAKTRLKQEILSVKPELLEDHMGSQEPNWEGRIDLETLTASLSPEDQEFIRDKLEGRVEKELAEKYGLTPEGIRSRWDAIKKRLRKKIG